MVVVNASNFLRDYWFILFPLVGLAAYLGVRYKRTDQGRAQWDRFKLKLPMKIGDVVLKVAMARFSRTLATLVSAGVDIVKALEITGSTAGNSVLEEAVADVRRRVHEGARIAQPLVDNAIFPPMVSQMVKIGEETGELDKMLCEDRGLLRGRGRRCRRGAHLDHRADHDDRRRSHGRHHHHQRCTCRCSRC